MVGKRQKKNSKPKLPVVLVMLVALAVVLSAPGPAGVAADSPVQQVPPAALTAPAVPQAPVTPEAPEEQAAEDVAEDVVPEEPWSPVPEGPAAEDTYFADAAFLGDSRTEGFSLYSSLDQGTYFFAVGATVESVFSKNAWETDGGGKIPLLDALAEGEYGKVYVMLGVNELGWARVETFYDQYAKVVDRIREDHPGAEVVLQSILPVSAAQEAKKSYVNNSRILEYNEAIMELAREKDCPYLNVAEAVMGEDGCLRPDWTFDGVHLNPAGCRAWLDYLRTHTV